MSNYTLSDILVRLNVSIRTHSAYAVLSNSNLAREISRLLYSGGFVHSFFIKRELIFIKLKYTCDKSLIKRLILVSTPGHRVIWGLSRLSLNYNKRSLRAIYIVSTNKGLLTSSDCLLLNHVGGEILFKIELIL